MANNAEISRNKETNQDRFVRIIERRVNKILNGLDSLSKCANKKNYEYGSEDVKQIFIEIERKVREVKMVFQRSNDSKKRWKLVAQKRLNLREENQ